MTDRIVSLEDFRCRRRAAAEAVKYWYEQEAALRSAEQVGHGLFKGCHDLLGQTLSPESQQRILRYLNAPTQKRWLETRSLIIVSHVTLWQAWCAVNPVAPRSGDKGFPSPETLRQAIRSAVEQRKAHIRDKLQELFSSGSRLD